MPDPANRHDSIGPGPDPPLVLIVDPNRDFRTILVHFLRHEGLAAEATGDPDEALALIRAAPPAAIIGEHPLRLRDGRLLCAVLQEEEDTASIPFVAVTARAFPEDIQHAEQTHHAGVFTKPVGPQRVSAHVRELLREVRERPGGREASAAPSR